MKLISFVWILEKRELAKRSQVIQRTLPRPTEINMNILRPTTDTPLTDLQRVCIFLNSKIKLSFRILKLKITIELN